MGFMPRYILTKILVDNRRTNVSIHVCSPFSLAVSIFPHAENVDLDNVVLFLQI